MVLGVLLLHCDFLNRDLAATLQHSRHVDGLSVQMHQLWKSNYHSITLGGRWGRIRHGVKKKQLKKRIKRKWQRGTMGEAEV